MALASLFCLYNTLALLAGESIVEGESGPYKGCKTELQNCNPNWSPAAVLKKVFENVPRSNLTGLCKSHTLLHCFSTSAHSLLVVRCASCCVVALRLVSCFAALLMPNNNAQASKEPIRNQQKEQSKRDQCVGGLNESCFSRIVLDS